MSRSKQMFLFAAIIILTIVMSLSAQNSLKIVYIQGEASLANGVYVPEGSVVAAYNNWGAKVSNDYTVTDAGKYTLRLEIADSTTHTFGLIDGDTIFVKVNGYTVTSLDPAVYPIPIYKSSMQSMEIIHYEFTADILSEISKSNIICFFWSNNSYLNGGKIKVDTKIEAFIEMPNGLLKKIGQKTAFAEGSFKIAVYGDEPMTTSYAEGAENGDNIIFFIDGAQAKVINGNSLFSTAEMDKEIDLWASTLPAGGPNSCIYTGKVLINGNYAPAGTVIKAVDKDGVVCGYLAASEAGNYSMIVYGDNSVSTEVYMDEGADENEVVSFYVDGITADQNPTGVTWTNGGNKTVDLSIINGNVIPTSDWCDFNGIESTFNGLFLSPGMVVDAYYITTTKDSIHCGTVIVSTNDGSFNLRVYGDWSESTDIIEGPMDGQKLVFKINGYLARVTSGSGTDTYQGRMSIKNITLQAPIKPPDDVTEIVKVKKTTQLKQNFPNPFNSRTMINFTLADAGKVSLSIYNLLGEEVTTLINGKMMTAGEYNLVWNGLNKNNKLVPTGVYYYRLKTDKENQIKKMIYLK